MKRILILSHNALSKTQNNGKTLEAFFRKYSPHNVAQIYLQPETPDYEYSNTYYRMTDYEALNSFIFGGGVGHEMLHEDHNDAFIDKTSLFVQMLYWSKRRNPEQNGINRLVHIGMKNRWPILIFIREYVWKFSRWNTVELNNWISEFKPDVLFFQASNGAYAYNIALKICEKHRIPLVLQLTDDYTHKVYEFSILEIWNKFLYLKYFKRAIKKSIAIISISEYMANEYSQKFGGNYITLMNSTRASEIKPEPNSISLVFMYAGNVLLNRWMVLKKIGDVLAKINESRSTYHKLRIHSPTPIPSFILNQLNQVNAIEVGASLNHEELIQEFSKSNVVVHVESFDKKMIKTTRLSISTKIPEYLATGRSILAIGPQQIASIKYLIDNQLACVITKNNEDILMQEIIQLIEAPDLRKIMAQNGFNHYLQFHDPDSIESDIENIIEVL